MSNILNNLQTSFIDKTIESDPAYNHQFISNNELTMRTQLIRLLKQCDEFRFCVAFISMSGIQILKKTLIELEEKNIYGEVITGNYLNFSNPLAIKELLKFKNIIVKMNYNNNLHAKGYFFKKNDDWQIIIGSSNLTNNALLKNQEWNLLVNSKENGQLTDDALNKFNIISSNSFNANEKLKEYSEAYQRHNPIKQFEQLQTNFTAQSSDIILPNKMQQSALNALELSRKNNKRKALIISATGSGKTYLSAMDVQKVNPNRCLFIVHRSTIIDKSKLTFETIIKTKKMGVFDGRTKEIADYLFANISTLAKDEYLNLFSPDHFDYIVIDEVHKSGSASYEKVINYFKPQFLLGMTATPERTDGYNIFNQFDNNIVYEIRMSDAINENLIVPFHYYGVSEILIDGNTADEKTILAPQYMTSRVHNLLEKSKQYGFDGDKVRGLIFVSSVAEAKSFAYEINKSNYRAISLDGSSSETERDQAIKNIALSTDNSHYIDYIVTVDIFNEGIDIPSINQVLLLRPTESSIIYIQQIGRGLRKSHLKSYLVILDFIGNYKTNFLIPVALTGNGSYDVDVLNQIVIEGTTFAPENCTIEFEKIPQDLILSNISQQVKGLKSNLKKVFIDNYKQLSYRLNRTPLLSDFYDNNMLSPELILKLKTRTNDKGYVDLVEEIEKEPIYNLTPYARLYLQYIYCEFSMAKRVHEMIILKTLLGAPQTTEALNNRIENHIHIKSQLANTNNALEHLQFKIFQKENNRKTFIERFNNLFDDDSSMQLLQEENEYFSIHPELLRLYNQEADFKMLLNEIIKLNIKYASSEFKQEDVRPLKLFSDYTRKDIFQLINADYHSGYQVSGYSEIKKQNSVLIFAKTDKSSYANQFISPNRLIWMSQNNKHLNKPNGSVLEKEIAANKKTLLLFIKKEEGEKSYFVGQAKVISAENTIQKNMHSTEHNIIKYILELEQSIPDYLYHYLNSK